MTDPSPAESHLMRRRPRHGTGPGGLVVYTLEDLATPADEDPKAVIEVRRTATTVVVVGGGVPPAHRGHGHGRRLGQQVIAALRAEGCRSVVTAEPTDSPTWRMLAELDFRPAESETWQLVL